MREEVVPLRKQLSKELEYARREAINTGVKVEPTEEEKRNGWTTETLTKYLGERMAAQSLAVDVKSLHRRKKPTKQNHTYRPHKWRR